MVMLGDRKYNISYSFDADFSSNESWIDLMDKVVSTIEPSSKKEGEDVSYRVNSEEEGCRAGYMPYTIALVDGTYIYGCQLTSSIVQGPRLIGTGNEVYTVTGYYQEYEKGYYRFDDENLYATTCHGFVATGGNQDFIDAYKSEIKTVEEIGGNVVIDIDRMHVPSYPGPNNVLEIEPLSSKIKESTIENQISLNFKVWPFPERDANPCDSHGIYIVE